MQSITKSQEAEACLNRGYPSDLVDTSVKTARRMGREDHLAIQPNTKCF